MVTQHLSDAELAGYVDHELPDAERRRADVHLERCAECRAAAVEIMRLADGYAARAEAVAGGSGARPPGPRAEARDGTPVALEGRRRVPTAARWARRGALLAACAAAVMVVARAPRPATDAPAPGVRVPAARRPTPGAPVRAAGAADGAASEVLVAVAPREGDVSGRPSAFVWRAAPVDAYRLTLLDESGSPLWTAETTDTALALPPDLTLRPGQPYFWRVDAIAEGIAVSTGARLLRVR